MPCSAMHCRATQFNAVYSEMVNFWFTTTVHFGSYTHWPICIQDGGWPQYPHCRDIYLPLWTKGAHYRADQAIFYPVTTALAIFSLFLCLLWPPVGRWQKDTNTQFKLNLKQPGSTGQLSGKKAEQNENRPMLTAIVHTLRTVGGVQKDPPGIKV